MKKQLRHALYARYLILLTALLCSTQLWAESYTLLIDDIGYTTEGNSLTINDYTNTDKKDIAIPATFTIDGTTYNVTSIGSRAFYRNYLTTVTIPNSVTSIGSHAFLNNQITTLTIPNSVTSIGSTAFNQNKIVEINGEASDGIIYARNADGTNNLSTIVSYGGEATVINFIPNTVTSIGYNAFSSNSLTSVTGIATFDWTLS